MFSAPNPVCFSPPGDLSSPPLSTAQVEGSSLHLVGFVTARLDMLQRLEDWCLAKNYGRETGKLS